MCYHPQTGDLVFFEQAPGPIGALVGLLDWPAPSGMKVSHCGIVNKHDDGVAYVIENVWIDPPSRYHRNGAPWQGPEVVGGVREVKLSERCLHGDTERRLLVVPRPDPTGDVITAGSAMITHSAYSFALLLLAGVASLYRRLPCTDRPNPYWQTVHLHARRIVNGLNPPDFVGTCAGTVAEIEHRASLDLNVCEPQCADPSSAWAMANHVVEVVEALAAVAWREARRVDNGLADRITGAVKDWQHTNAAIERLNEVGDDESQDAARPVHFGWSAAVDALRRLHQFHMLKPGTEAKLLHDLLVTFGVIDELVQPPGDDGLPAPGHGDPVYPPLMSLGLMLQQHQFEGPYEPYTGPCPDPCPDP